MKENVYQKELERIAQIEEKFGDFVDFVVSKTFSPHKHRMRISEEDFCVVEDFSDLERADLEDFWKFG